MLETPFSCSICLKEFAQLQDLGHHVETIHVQLKQPEEKNREIDVAYPKENVIVDVQKNIAKNDRFNIKEEILGNDNSNFQDKSDNPILDSVTEENSLVVKIELEPTETDFGYEENTSYFDETYIGSEISPNDMSESAKRCKDWRDKQDRDLLRSKDRERKQNARYKLHFH
jgi:hypothetical protein